MPAGLHIFSFQSVLKKERKFLKSLTSPSLPKRKLILEQASPKQLRLIQKLLSSFVRGEIGVTAQFFNRVKRARKLTFIEENFSKIRSDPNLKAHLLSLASVVHLFVRVILKKK